MLILKKLLLNFYHRISFLIFLKLDRYYYLNQLFGRLCNQLSEVETGKPAFLTITIKTPVTDREDATHDLAGNSYEKELNKIVMWTDSQPAFTGDDNGFIT